MESLIFILGIGILCFIYIKYLVGSALYKKIKEVVWGTLFVSNFLSSIFWFSISYSFLSNQERILLMISILVSASLTIQIVLKYRNKIT
ncbi:hypothetical protein [Bacillus solimangrovi]|uniref:hypothetical protein n=1 Tax=Bacillus solimangrovi TaxID=1305675 RepID=UPI001C311848|nr:hypothetical protein [Bacillus solimangrovi]